MYTEKCGKCSHGSNWRGEKKRETVQLCNDFSLQMMSNDVINLSMRVSNIANGISIFLRAPINGNSGNVE